MLYPCTRPHMEINVPLCEGPILADKLLPKLVSHGGSFGKGDLEFFCQNRSDQIDFGVTHSFFYGSLIL